MTPKAAVASLDRQLRMHGETVTFKRPHDGSVASVTVKAFVRFAQSSDLVASVRQTLRTVVVSPTGLEDWPDGHPDEGDWCEIAGQDCTLMQAKPKRMADALVRVDMVVKG